MGDNWIYYCNLFLYKGIPAVWSYNDTVFTDAPIVKVANTIAKITFYTYYSLFFYPVDSTTLIIHKTALLLKKKSYTSYIRYNMNVLKV